MEKRFVNSSDKTADHDSVTDRETGEDTCSNQGACALPMASFRPTNATSDNQTIDETQLKSHMAVEAAENDRARAMGDTHGASHSARIDRVLPGDTSQDISLHSGMYNHNQSFSERSCTSLTGRGPAYLSVKPHQSDTVDDFSSATFDGGATEKPWMDEPKSLLPTNIPPNGDSSLSVNQRLSGGEISPGQGSRRVDYSNSNVNNTPSTPVNYPPATHLIGCGSFIGGAAGDNISNSYSRMTTTHPSAAPPDQGSSSIFTGLSHSASVVSLRSIIPEDCPVRKLPGTIIDIINDGLEDDSWRKLVEYYGWNYDQTERFAKRNKNCKILAALLKHEHFQMYDLNQLREDLRRIPRLDVLEDLKEAIEEHNHQAGQNGGQR